MKKIILYVFIFIFSIYSFSFAKFMGVSSDVIRYDDAADTPTSTSSSTSTSHTHSYSWVQSDGKHHEHCSCGANKNYGTCSGGTATCTDKAVCSTCGNSYGDVDPKNHGDYTAKYEAAGHTSSNYYYHKKLCSGCNAVLDSMEGCDFSNDNGDYHTACKSCNQKQSTTTHHGFGTLGLWCSNPNCTTKLTLSSESGLKNLPSYTSYRVRDGIKCYDHLGAPDEISATYNLTPYLSERDDTIGETELRFNSYVHELSNKVENVNNVADLTRLIFGGVVYNQGLEPTATVYNTPSSINSSMATLSRVLQDDANNMYVLGILNNSIGESYTLKDKGKSVKFNTSYRKDTHTYWVGIYIFGQKVSAEEAKITCPTSEKDPTPNKYYAHLVYMYRDTNENTIIGGPKDDTTAAKVYDTPNFYTPTLSANAQVEAFDKLGYRYVGYKVDGGSLVKADEKNSKTETYSYKAQFKDSSNVNIYHRVTFYYEPVKITVEHFNVSRNTLIETKKNTNGLALYLPGFYKGSENIGNIINDYDASSQEVAQCNESKKVNGYYAISQNITSFNKYLWPGYILKDYSIVQTADKNVVYSTQEYKTDVTPTATNYEGITTYAGLTGVVPQEVYQKNIVIKVDCSTIGAHTIGFMPDITIRFDYANVDVKIEHRNFKEPRNLLKTLDGTDLSYTQTLNGHYFAISSLITQGKQVCSQLNKSYDISGYIIKEIDIKRKDITLVSITEPFKYGQTSEINISGDTADPVANMIYYVITANDKYLQDGETNYANIINRIGNDITFTFYYEKTPMLRIQHLTENGYKLLPDEYAILSEDGVNASSKDLSKYGYVYTKYVLDGGTASTASSVLVAQNGEKDRELIFYYKENYPTLTVKYQDEAGKTISPSQKYTMSTDSTVAYAKDLSNIDYEYIKYNLDDGTIGTNNTVTVKNTGKDREIIFIYKQNEGTPEKTPETIPETTVPSGEVTLESSSYEKILLKSNDRGNEEYNTLKAIPTSEDLYANVITDSYILSNSVAQISGEAILHVKIVQPYFKTSNTDSKETIEAIGDEDKVYIIDSQTIKIPVNYTYIGANNVQLNIIEKAIVHNDAIEVRNDGSTTKKEDNQVTIYPNYPTLPSLNYEAGGELNIPDFAVGTAIYGTTVKDACDGMKSGIYKYVTGFYNVTYNGIKDGKYDYSCEFIVPEIQYSEKAVEMYNDIVDNYKNNPQIITKALEEVGTTVKMDSLSVSELSGSLTTILSGAYLPIDREYTGLWLESNYVNGDKTQPYANLHPQAELISGDTLYKHTEIYVSKDSKNIEYTTSGDIWYQGYQRVNPNSKSVETATLDSRASYKKYIFSDSLTTGDPYVKSRIYTIASQAGNSYLIEKKKAIPGDSVFVYTPIVNNTKIQIDEKTMPTASKFIGVANKSVDVTLRKSDGTDGKEVPLIIGEDFIVTIPNSGDHISYKGYDDSNENKNYNYDGLNANGDGFNTTGRSDNKYQETFAKSRQIRFAFDVVYKETDTSSKYYKAGTWIELGVSDKTEFKFMIPEWTKEKWHDEQMYQIETRIVAENIPEDIEKEMNDETKSEKEFDSENAIFKDDDSDWKKKYSTVSTRDKNKDVKYNKNKITGTSEFTYIAYNEKKVNVIAQIFDFEVRATNDIDYASNTNGSASIANGLLPYGSQGTSSNKAYAFGIKLGNSVYFDIATSGWHGQTTKEIGMTPKYYYVSQKGGIPTAVNLYYKRTANGPYIKLGSEPKYEISTVMSRDVRYGKSYNSTYPSLKTLAVLDFDANRELEQTTNTLSASYNEVKNELINNNVITSTDTFIRNVKVILGDTDKLTLSYKTRLQYLRLIEKLNKIYTTAGAPTTILGMNYYMGHWYGAFQLPSSTIAVGTDVTTPSDANKKKDGYILVTFDDVKAKDPSGLDYLQAKPVDSNYTIKLPNGATASVPENADGSNIPVVIYELISNKADFRNEQNS